MTPVRLSLPTIHSDPMKSHDSPQSHVWVFTHPTCSPDPDELCTFLWHTPTPCVPAFMHSPLSGIIFTPLDTLYYFHSNPMLTFPIAPCLFLILLQDLIWYISIYKSQVSTHVLLSLISASIWIILSESLETWYLGALKFENTCKRCNLHRLKPKFSTCH